MKYLNRYRTKYTILMGLLVIVSVFQSCEDEESAYTGPITIEKVYLQDVNSSVPNREVDFVRLGQNIRIEGSGFSDVRKIYINGYETYFNPALATDNNVWVKLSKYTPIVEANADDRNTIRFENAGSEFSFQIEIRDAAPSISRISHTLPLVGETVTVYGVGLLEVTKVILPGGLEVTDGIIWDTDDAEFFSFVMPDGVSDEGGYITAETANGIAFSPAYFNFKKGVILDFDGNGTHGFWGDAVGMVSDSDLVALPCGVGHLSQGIYAPMRPERIETIAANDTRCTEVWTAGNDVDDWRGQITPYIPATTPLDSIAFQFDIFVPNEWTETGFLKIMLINSYNGGEWKGSATYPAYIKNWVPWVKDSEAVPYITEGWTTVTIPFTEMHAFTAEFGDFTFEDLLIVREESSYKNFGIYFENPNFTMGNLGGSADIEFPASATDVEVYIDNWRVVSLYTPPFSDFEDE